jgi:adenylate cyclase
VNLAARLEQMNKEIGTTILIAGETVRAAGEGLEAQQVGEIPIRGRAAADVYSI